MVCSNALGNSLVVATIASMTSTAIGTLAALAFTRHQFAGRNAFGLLMLLPLALPVVVVGVALLSVLMLAGSVCHCLRSRWVTSSYALHSRSAS